MPKPKTHKATAKRLDVRVKRKNGKKIVKIIKRTDGQDHFNSRETGKTKRNKRSDSSVSRSLHRTVLRALPHAQ